MGTPAPATPQEALLEDAASHKADMTEFGFQLTTNEKNEMVWVRPLSVLNQDEVERAGMSDFDVLEILEVKAIGVLSMVVARRQELQKLLQDQIAKAAGEPQIKQ